MSTLRQFIGVILLCVTCATSSVTRASSTLPEERDRLVLESLLLHLLNAPTFDMAAVPTFQRTERPSFIVLHTRTPEKTGFLMPEQIRSDIGGRTLPKDAEGDLRRRNTPASAKTDQYDSVTAFYTNLTFATGIVVADPRVTAKRRRSLISFRESYPNARGWLESYLPGYSKDGTRAVVRAGVGPSAHGSMLTALFEKRGDKWVVKWFHIAYYV